jgi:YVTN family beta-propeller protein
MHRSSFTLAALVVLAALPACSNGTEPDPTEGKTHPAGTVADRITFESGHIGIAVAPDGMGYVAGGTGLDRFSTQSPFTRLTPLTTGPAPRDLVIDRAGTTAFAATDNGKVYVVDLKTGTMKATLAIDTLYHSGDARLNLLAVAPDGSRAYLITEGRLWSLPTNGAAATATGHGGSSIAVSPTTGAIYLTNIDGDFYAARLDPATFTVQAQTSTRLYGAAVAVAPRGDEVYVGGSGGVLAILDPTTLAERGVVNLGTYTGISGIAVSPDGTQIYLALSGSKVAIVERATRTVLSTLTLGGIPLGVAFDPRGTTAFVVNLDTWVDVIR